MRRLLVPLLFVTAAPLAAQSTTVIVVRHAERADTTRDPGLSAAGEARAAALAEALRQAGVTHIVTTQFRRTQLTAAPLAQALGLTPAIIETQRDIRAHAQAIAAHARQLPAGSTVLVVGHSNTINLVAEMLGGPAMASLCDSDYDSMFTLVLKPSGAPLIRARFGQPDNDPPECAR